MCPIVHIAALAFADDAFHPDLTNAGLTPYNMHSFRSPSGRITIDFNFRDDILDVPVFRRSKQNLGGVNVDPIKALSASSIAYWTRLGQRAGFEHPFHTYCIRRQVGTELTGLPPAPRQDVRHLADCSL